MTARTGQKLTVYWLLAVHSTLVLPSMMSFNNRNLASWTRVSYSLMRVLWTAKDLYSAVARTERWRKTQWAHFTDKGQSGLTSPESSRVLARVETAPLCSEHAVYTNVTSPTSSFNFISALSACWI